MKNILLLLVLFISYSTISAQETDNADAVVYPTEGAQEFGLGFAYNSSFLTENGFTQLDGYKPTSGYSLSAQYEYYLSKNWGLKTKLNLDYKGLTSDTDPEMVTDLLYLTLPVMASWHFGKKKRWYLHFGVYTGYLLLAELEGTDIKQFVNSMDYGTDFGVGVRIPAGDKWFFIETDGQTSFGSPFKANSIFNTEASLARNTLGFGLIF